MSPPRRASSWSFAAEYGGVPVHAADLVLVVVARLLAIQIRLDARRVGHLDLRRQVVDHHGRHVERVLQEPAQTANRHQLETETQPIVITTLGRHQIPVRIIQEEEPLKSEPAGQAGR
jgi:hypothetical protein